MVWYTILLVTYVHSAQIENTNTPGRIIYKGISLLERRCPFRSNSDQDMSAFITSTRIRMTQPCVTCLHNALMARIEAEDVVVGLDPIRSHIVWWEVGG